MSHTNDVFISYDREDEARVKMLVQALEESGWSVSWDRQVPIGWSYDEVIGKAMRAAQCVVVVWSAASQHSKWVQKEAAHALRRGILTVVLLDQVPLPPLLSRIEVAELIDWPLPGSEDGLQQMLDRVGVIIKPAPKSVMVHTEGAPSPPQTSSPRQSAPPPVTLTPEEILANDIPPATPIPKLAQLRNSLPALNRTRMLTAALGVLLLLIVAFTWSSSNEVPDNQVIVSHTAEAPAAEAPAAGPSEALREQRAYFVVGTRITLHGREIVNEAGQPLPSISRLAPIYFNAVTTRAQRIPVPECKNQTCNVLSRHNMEPSSYMFSPNSDVLYINEVDRFWATSRYLVIEVQPSANAK